jgi:carnitine O-octanoyltransferase
MLDTHMNNFMFLDQSSSMNRENIYILPEDAPSTFSRDENLDPLPLPSLEDTMNRYYDSLKPFGTEDELKESLKLINEFKNGIGKKLQNILVDRTVKHKNWVRH